MKRYESGLFAGVEEWSGRMFRPIPNPEGFWEALEHLPPMKTGEMLSAGNPISFQFVIKKSSDGYVFVLRPAMMGGTVTQYVVKAKELRSGFYQLHELSWDEDPFA